VVAATEKKTAPMLRHQDDVRIVSNTAHINKVSMSLLLRHEKKRRGLIRSRGVDVCPLSSFVYYTQM